MVGQKHVIETLLYRAGIKINGPGPWDIQVSDEQFYARILRNKELGLGEAYMEGMWRCERVDEFIYRILAANLDREIRGSVKMLPFYLSALLFNHQSRRRSHRVVECHYGIDNDLFMSILAPYNQYSCAYFQGTDDLQQAQLNKMDLICQKIGLGCEDRLLDIGCGWGGFSRYAAERYGCTVTAVNISGEQIRYASEFCKDLPVRILNCDYRDIRGIFDKIVSIGMFEHVGQKNYKIFMRVVDRCLKDDGIFLLQTIGSNNSQVRCEPWTAKYIFPNSMLPSIAQIGEAVEDLFVMEDWQNLGPHYDKTLMLWNDNFQKAWPNLKERYNEHFKRMFEYFLLSCAGAFRARHMQLWQIVFTKCGTRQPDCRK